VAVEIEGVWLRDLRYQHWEAHLVRIEPTSVELDVVTATSEDGYYISGLIVVTWPTQTARPEGVEVANRPSRQHHERADLPRVARDAVGMAGATCGGQAISENEEISAAATQVFWCVPGSPRTNCARLWNAGGSSPTANPCDRDAIAILTADGVVP
jgi:hypothetical protein